VNHVNEVGRLQLRVRSKTSLSYWQGLGAEFFVRKGSIYLSVPYLRVSGLMF
jgi:hypothetical protein